MRYIVINPSDLSISIESKRMPGRISIKASPWNKDPIKNPVSDRLLYNIIYPDIYARDKKKGRKVGYSLIPPDPWLVAVGAIMWEGIIQGFAWDAVRLSVGRAVQAMTAADLAPKTGMQKKALKGDIEFVWTGYRSDRKHRSIYLKLQAVYESERKNKKR